LEYTIAVILTKEEKSSPQQYKFVSSTVRIPNPNIHPLRN